ncbi:hypothetical protein HGB07_01315 [Candidatus Roizmanbacteria bacterium]|nr:hypothetical protein [Candidatus Roizmanbacteria bacterium]
MKTAYWFTNEYFLYLCRGTNGIETNLFVEFRLKEPAENELIRLENACREFSNRLIDQVVRQSVLTETSAFRDTLVKKAFFEGRLRTDLVNAEK